MRVDNVLAYWRGHSSIITAAQFRQSSAIVGTGAVSCVRRLQACTGVISNVELAGVNAPAD
jgi:hypothetical protein